MFGRLVSMIAGYEIPVTDKFADTMLKSMRIASVNGF